MQQRQPSGTLLVVALLVAPSHGMHVRGALLRREQQLSEQASMIAGELEQFERVDRIRQQLNEPTADALPLRPTRTLKLATAVRKIA